MAETNPLCASEITSSVPCKPRSFRYSKMLSRSLKIPLTASLKDFEFFLGMVVKIFLRSELGIANLRW